jgi:autonomous glycyl radical cofactor GrcA
MFLDHDKFPWFRKAPVEHIFNVIEEGEGHFHWPNLDVDLDVDRIKHPEKYPLIADDPRP